MHEKLLPKDFSELCQQILLVLGQVSLCSQGADDSSVSLQLCEKHTETSNIKHRYRLLRPQNV